LQRRRALPYLIQSSLQSCKTDKSRAKQ
jgi:hypothetical protein